jgi:sigma-B regulation protein RsbU (phosphoserine phosphatase)
MKILIADDDKVSRTVLEKVLRGWGHEIIGASDGLQAWSILSRDDAPPLAILDWMMPGLEGPEVCLRIRALPKQVPPYLILLTSKDATGDIVAGLDSGADDYVTKPFDRAELQSRIKVGQRVIALQRGLADRVRELEDSLAQVKQLRGMLPICAWCKNVRNDGNYWQTVEAYIASHADVRFTHGICPPCLERVEKEAKAGLEGVLS